MFEQKWFTAGEKPTEHELSLGYTPGNVLGRFEDHRVIDGPASRRLMNETGRGKNVYKIGVMLVSKAVANALGHQTQDICGQQIRFDVNPDEASAAISRFPQAWEEYQTRRTAPIQPDEGTVLRSIGLTVTTHVPTTQEKALEEAFQNAKERIETPLTKIRKPRGRPRKTS